MSTRKNVSKHLSKVISIKEILVETVSKTMNKQPEEVEKALENSVCGQGLNDMNSDYYLSDINLIVSQFTAECEEKYSWTQI